MADILAANVTYTEVAGSAKKLNPKGGTRRQYDVAFGNAALTYNSTTNVPLTKASLGCPTVVSSLKALSRTTGAAGTNYVWEWDKSETSPTLVGYEVRTGQAGPEGLTEVANGTAIAAQTIRVEVEGY